MFVLRNRYDELHVGRAIVAAIVVMLAAQLIAKPLSEPGNENDPPFKLGATLVYGIIAVTGNLLLFKLIYKRALRGLGILPGRGSCVSQLSHNRKSTLKQILRIWSK
jgi:hypothetical protein